MIKNYCLSNIEIEWVVEAASHKIFTNRRTAASATAILRVSGWGVFVIDVTLRGPKSNLLLSLTARKKNLRSSRRLDFHSPNLTAGAGVGALETPKSL